jgi:type I restriction enzyme S subunit
MSGREASTTTIPGKYALSVGDPAIKLPVGWSWALLTDIAALGTGHTPSRKHPEYWGDDVPWLGIRDAGAHHGRIINDTTQNITYLGLANSSARLLPKGTVCLSRTASVGYVVKMGRDMATSQDFVTWSCGEALDPDYLMQALIAEGEDIRRFGEGSTHTTIYFPEVKAFHLALPPLPEQRRIVAKIDSLTGKSKRAREHLDHIPRLVEKYKQAVLAAAFRGDLTHQWRVKQPDIETAEMLISRTKQPAKSRGGRDATTNVRPGIAGLSINNPGTPVPAGWAWTPLGRIAKQETGHTPSRARPEYWDGGVPWIGIRDAGKHHGTVIRDTIQTISDAGLDNSSARLLPAGTVCLSRTASVGYVTIMGSPMATSQDFATWTCSDALVPRFLMYALMAEGDNIRKFGEGSTHTTIYFPEIRAMHICLAPLAEQGEIVRRIESAFARVDSLAAEATSTRKLIDKLDQAILAKAFLGELVPQDPTDEPASVLLERIHAERVAAL